MKNVFLLFILMAAEVAAPMESGDFSRAMLFQKDPVGEVPRELLEPDEKNYKSAERSLRSLVANRDDTEEEQLYEKQLYKELSGVFPLRLHMDEMRSVLGKCYPRGLFHLFTLHDFSILSRIFLTPYGLENYRVGGCPEMLRCVIGAFRPVIGALKLKVGSNDVQDLIMRALTGVFWGDQLLNCLEKNNALALADPIICSKTIRKLFPGGMFRSFSDPEIFLITRLFPKKAMSGWDLDFFTECMTGAVRTLVLREYGLNPYSENLSNRNPGTTANFYKKRDAEEAQAFYKACGRYIFEKLAPKTVLPDGVLSKSDAEMLTEALNALKAGKCPPLIPKDKNEAFRIWTTLAPEGIFHVFSPLETLLLNLTFPRDLNAKEKLIWMEWLIGSYKSMAVTANMADPLSGMSDKEIPSMAVAASMADPLSGMDDKEIPSVGKKSVDDVVRRSVPAQHS
jgi:hypothetical protein